MFELSRYVTFGQYVNNDSILARMDPRAKLVCAILLIVLVSFLNTFPVFFLCLIFCTILHLASRISIGYILRSLKPFFLFLIIAFIFEVLFYAPARAPHWIWHWWFLGLSWAGITASLLTMIRVIFLYYLATMLTFTTSLVDLTDGLESLVSPLQKLGIPVNALVMVLVIALKFVPIFVNEVERLMKAQAARGLHFDQGNLLQRISKMALLLIPLFVSGFQKVKVLNVAMEARCYGSHRGWHRTKLRALHYKRFDLFALALTIVVCILLITVNILTA
ncbi:energy-coupling factor transporter transmembrane component T family protein [Dictyobacter arantiisoli]|uniref:Energy-coupling factor transporter transmembrane protein EcfT n=1 Tax=Dictyobacter arantiisoli TaxID=2014874 RepID=A0A5A5T9I2_9CHLR|nr:energy-coupling factor transporter transmembrane component T [Dictyobacter arantiisoli]GCF08072.1 energy-coupling factor transporter transmembrane protein EcfT [Dictyobacter arantiisoli]